MPNMFEASTHMMNLSSVHMTIIPNALTHMLSIYDVSTHNYDIYF
jgi:hypothetical protein